MMGANESNLFSVETSKPLKIKYRNIEIICEEEEYKKIEMLAKDIFHKLNIDKVETTEFPINQIDGLNCKPILYMNYFHNLHTNEFRYSIVFRIISNKIMNDESELEKVYYMETLTEETNKLITVVDIIEILLIIKYLF